MLGGLIRVWVYEYCQGASETGVISEAVPFKNNYDAPMIDVYCLLLLRD